MLHSSVIAILFLDLEYEESFCETTMISWFQIWWSKQSLLITKGRIIDKKRLWVSKCGKIVFLLQVNVNLKTFCWRLWCRYVWMWLFNLCMSITMVCECWFMNYFWINVLIIHNYHDFQSEYNNSMMQLTNQLLDSNQSWC
jgi:hypothetical protein